MADMNTITFTGHLTKDATLSLVGNNGTQITKFSVANNTGFGDYAKTQFFDVQMWGKQGASLCEYLKKGKQVGITGKIESNNYRDKEGNMRYAFVVTASDIVLLGGNKNESQDNTSRDGE